jgi:hypothetical protein
MMMIPAAFFSGAAAAPPSAPAAFILDTFTAADNTDPTTRDLDVFPAVAGLSRWRFTHDPPNTEGRIVGGALTFKADADQSTGAGYVILELVADDASSLVTGFPYALTVEAVNEYAGTNDFGGWIDVRLFSDSGDGLTDAGIFVQNHAISAYIDGFAGNIGSPVIAATPGTVHKLAAFVESNSLTFIANGVVVGTYTGSISNTDPINMVWISIVPPLDNSLSRLSKVAVYAGLTLAQAVALTV